MRGEDDVETDAGADHLPISEAARLLALAGLPHERVCALIRNGVIPVTDGHIARDDLLRTMHIVIAARQAESS